MRSSDSSHKQSPIDCAELFREKVGKANYYAFLREQFVTKESR